MFCLSVYSMWKSRKRTAGYTADLTAVHTRTCQSSLYLTQSCAASQASSIENKQDWIKHIREVIQERTVHLRGALKEPIHIPKATTAKHKGRR